MRFLASFFGIAQLVSAAVDVTSIKYAQNTDVVPNSYIVTLSPNSHLKRGFISPHEELYHDLRRRGTKWKVIREYSSDVFTGAAVQLGSESDLVKLVKVQGVQSVTPNYIHPPPEAVLEYATTGKAKRAVPEGVVSTHAMTGVDKLHAEGYFGRGIKIGIIDSGVDYTHPALGGGFGPGHKIIGGYDFVGDAYTGNDGPPPTPDNDPLDQCNGHGTHVAGIIGANPNNPQGISGVAYESDLNVYRVLGCKGLVSEEILIAALLRADEDGNDVVTLSVGTSKGWANSVSGVIAGRIADKGRIVINSAGNKGERGAWYTTGLGVGPSVISVGSVDNTMVRVQNAIVSNGRKIRYLSFEPLRIPSSLLVYATSNNPSIENDACNPLPTNTPKLSNRLVLIQTGGCPLVTKFDNAAVYGARYFLIYANQDHPLQPLTADTAAHISRSDGLFLLQRAISRKYTVSFPDSPSTSPVPSSGLMSSSSRYGPSYDMYLGPALVAPGGFILSTMPISLGSWGIKSGTSFAAPLVAGSVALLLQAKGRTTGNKKNARAIFQNTASPVGASANSDMLATASHQGAGLIDVYNAVKNTGSLLPSELLLNDTAHFRKRHALKLHNGGRESVTYTLRHVPAGTALTMNGMNVNSGPVPLVSGPAVVTISPSEITLPAGRTRSITISFKPPTGLDATTFPVYSGYIHAMGSDGTYLQSTYLGLAAKLKDAKVLDNTDTHLGHKLPLLIDSEGAEVPPEGSARYTMAGDKVPYVIYRLVQGTPRLRIDLIDSDTHIVANQRRSFKTEAHAAKRCETSMGPRSSLSERSFLDCLIPSKPCCGTFASVRTLGILYHADHQSRHNSAKTLKDQGYSSLKVTYFANRTAIPNGKYRVLLRALKITGNPGKPQDYEVWTSPEIVIRRA